MVEARANRARSDFFAKGSAAHGWVGKLHPAQEHQHKPLPGFPTAGPGPTRRYETSSPHTFHHPSPPWQVLRNVRIARAPKKFAIPTPYAAVRCPFSTPRFRFLNEVAWAKNVRWGGFVFARLTRKGRVMDWHHTTICAVRREGVTALACDGQVTLGTTVLKHGACKLRRLVGGRVLAGFAGSVADALALFTRFEAKLEEFGINLERAAVELARDWRTDRALRHLEALMIVADSEKLLLLSGSGEVIVPDDGILAVGSGGPLALAAARALVQFTNLPAPEIAREALRIAAGIDLYTNDRITVEVVP